MDGHHHRREEEGKNLSMKGWTAVSPLRGGGKNLSEEADGLHHRREEEGKNLSVKGRTIASPQRGGGEEPQNEGTDGRVTTERRRGRT